MQSFGGGHLGGHAALHCGEVPVLVEVVQRGDRITQEQFISHHLFEAYQAVIVIV
jgi:hypothetical protein